MTTKEYFLQTWLTEAKTTINAFKALPTDKLDYRPHPKTRSAMEIVNHLAPHTNEILGVLETGTLNYVTNASFPTVEDAINAFETANAKLEKAVNSVDEKTWDEKIVPMMIGENKVWECPMRDMCWSFLLDIIHHRGQLSTYYRPMGTRNPSIYGPTAETMEEQMAAASN
ncbi:MAG: DinB family protein [Bacteroidota bacterium]